MQHRVILEPIFILHQRPFSNTSLIVDMFTMRYGRIVAVARSARGHKSRYRGMLQAFTPMLASWSGRNELKTLGQVELSGAPYQIEGRALLCGFYVNELLVQLLHRDDPYPMVFQHYQNLLHQLETKGLDQAALRYFEKHLLHELGYGLPLINDAQTGLLIEPEKQYQYLPERGFFHCRDEESVNVVFQGSSIIALVEETLSTEQHLLDAKRLMRMVFARHLNGKVIKSRELMV